MDIKVAAGTDQKQWDDIVGASPHGTVFHTWRFLKIIEKYSNTTLHPLMGIEKGKCVALLPCFSGKKSGLTTLFSPPPWIAIPYLGPVIAGFGKEPQYTVEPRTLDFHQGVEEYMSGYIRPNYTVIATPPGLADVRMYTWNGYAVTPLYNYVMDLTVGEEALHAAMKKKAKQELRRVERKGVSVELGGRKDVAYIHESVNKRYDEQGKSQPVPLDYFLDVFDAYPDNVKVFIAKYEGEPISGHIDICYKTKVSSWVGSAKAGIKGVSPNDLLNWEAVKYALNIGMTEYEIIGANTPRLSPYKIKYNPRPELYFQAKKYSPFFIGVGEAAYKGTKTGLEWIRSGGGR